MLLVGGERVHLRCLARATQIEARELQADTQAAQAPAQETLDQVHGCSLAGANARCVRSVSARSWPVEASCSKVTSWCMRGAGGPSHRP
jgi:hypothetical protein